MIDEEWYNLKMDCYCINYCIFGNDTINFIPMKLNIVQIEVKITIMNSKSENYS